MNLNVKIKKTRENAQIPKYATEFSACGDLTACIDEAVTIGVGEIVKIPTGIAAEPERNDVVGLVFGRSGLGVKHGITLANSVGVIDSDYRGEIMVSLINRGSEAYTVQPGERIAQLMFAPIYTASFIPCDELGETERGEGGFGHTGRQ